MPLRYAYSYDREDFTGSFDTPQEALKSGIANSEGVSSPPTTIYVGQVESADPQATEHAEQVINNMRRRALAAFGRPAQKYLSKVSKAQLGALDAALARTILAWLNENDLGPRFSKVSAVHEYPVDIPPAKTAPTGGGQREVSDMGMSNQL